MSVNRYDRYADAFDNPVTAVSIEFGNRVLHWGFMENHAEEWHGAALTIDGQTFEEWASELFEYESCDECGSESADHAPAVVLGHWFAVCQGQS